MNHLTLVGNLTTAIGGSPHFGLETEMLAERGGPLLVEPTLNGPLLVRGNLELCCGTGRVVLHSTEARLCRCGRSRNRPHCDGSHVAVGFRSENGA